MPRSKRDPSRRVGWSKLSPSYRKRLAGAGVSREYWERGGDLRRPRSHPTPPPPYAAPREATERYVTGAGTDRDRIDLERWRRRGAPDWLPGPAWMTNDVAAALSVLPEPRFWQHVDLYPAAEGAPWLMVVDLGQGRYPMRVEIPGGVQAQQVIRMLRDPVVYAEDTDAWGKWEDDDEGVDFDVHGTQ